MFRSYTFRNLPDQSDDNFPIYENEQRKEPKYYPNSNEPFDARKCKTALNLYLTDQKRQDKGRLGEKEYWINQINSILDDVITSPDNERFMQNLQSKIRNARDALTNAVSMFWGPFGKPISTLGSDILNAWLLAINDSIPKPTENIRMVTFKREI